MEHEVVRRNFESLERLRSIGSRLSDDQLIQPIDAPWTAAGLLAHTAFWDRFVEARWRHAMATGRAAPESIDDGPLEWINDSALPQWVAVSPRAAVAECLAAAQSVNELIAELAPDVVDDVARSDRPRLVDRSIHRGQHADTIEAAFGTASHESP